MEWPATVHVTNEIVDDEGYAYSIGPGRTLICNGKALDTQMPVQFVIYFDGVVYTHCDPMDGWVTIWWVWKAGAKDTFGCYRMRPAGVPRPDKHVDHCLAHWFIRDLLHGTPYKLRGMHGVH